MSLAVSIVWFCQDLRIDDNPALLAAHQRGRAVVPVYIWNPQEDTKWTKGGASRWWLHHSLRALDRRLRARNSRLILCMGDYERELLRLCKQTGAQTVYWNRRYEPYAIQSEERIISQLQQNGIASERFNASLWFEPWTIQTRAGTPFKVFTPFWRACLDAPHPLAPKDCPTRLKAVPETVDSLPLDALELEPKIDWAAGLRETWEPGETGARKLFDLFLDELVTEYPVERDRPDRRGTSRLSPHLHFGEISPRRLWQEASARLTMRSNNQVVTGVETYLRQLGWREFAYHLLYHFPDTDCHPLRGEFERFPWKRNKQHLNAWQNGQTGVPLVDAGMRELWHTGWMHNRVRMVVASYLVKHLLIPWQEGAAWFWDTLVDADLPNNTLGWQWTAGCGADAAPYFRIFNPVTQGEKFDPDGTYIRRWVSELKKLPTQWIHKPWLAPRARLDECGIQMGKTYPLPLVDHSEARDRALAAYETMRKNRLSL